MTSRSGARVALVVVSLVVALCHNPVSAQSGGNPWREGTMLSGFAGAGRDIGTTPVFGGAIAWEAWPHLAIEGRGTWFALGDGANAFAASIGGRVPLRPATRVVPFVAAGVGLHRATFDSTTTADVPDFFARRMRSGSAHTFDDLAVLLGAGTDFYLAQHLAIRPEVSALLVKGPSSTRTIPTVGVHLAYHFENHVIRPFRPRSDNRTHR